MEEPESGDGDRPQFGIADADQQPLTPVKDQEAPNWQNMKQESPSMSTISHLKTASLDHIDMSQKRKKTFLIQSPNQGARWTTNFDTTSTTTAEQHLRTLKFKKEVDRFHSLSD